MSRPTHCIKCQAGLKEILLKEEDWTKGQNITEDKVSEQEYNYIWRKARNSLIAKIYAIVDNYFKEMK